MSDVFSAWDNDHLHGLPCRVLLPQHYDPRRRHPLVVFLHGSGERGDDNVAQLRNGLRAFEQPMLRGFSPIVVAPQIPKGLTFGGSWYGGAAPLQQTVIDVVKDLAGRGSVDEDRVYGVGFSMGAIGLWDILARHRGVFAAGVVLAGDAAVALRGFPLWAVHGANDTLVLADNTRAVEQILPAPFRFTELRGLGHDICAAAFAEPSLWSWLFEQRRAPTTS